MLLCIQESTLIFYPIFNIYANFSTSKFRKKKKILQESREFSDSLILNFFTFEYTFNHHIMLLCFGAIYT